jgi:segregation and condensation protein B
MSLKSKLEAVIYAAEEPVTLAQLAALFTADALEWKAQLEAASAAEPAEAAPAEPLPLLSQAFDYLGLEETASPMSAEFTSDYAKSEAEPEPASSPDLGDPGPSASNNGDIADAPGAAPVPTADAEGELRRQARQRDREVRAILIKLLEELIASYASDDRGIEIREIAGGYRMATKPECHDAVRGFVRSLKPALKLSLPALETLAVIAYKQPVTAPEVNEIRGVESGATLGSLLSRKLIATAGRKPVIGRPILYKTTREFLLRFGLKDVSELPSMEEFEKMAAIELDEQESSVSGESDPEGNLEFSEEPYDEPDEASETEASQPDAASPPIPEVSSSTEAAPATPSSTEHAETEASSHD